MVSIQQQCSVRSPVSFGQRLQTVMGPASLVSRVCSSRLGVMPVHAPGPAPMSPQRAASGLGSVGRLKPLNLSTLGFQRFAALSPALRVGDPHGNARIIGDMAEQAAAQQATVIVCPEMALTGYTIGDAVGWDSVLCGVRQALQALCERMRQLNALLLVGAPYRTHDGRVFNCAFALARGRVIAAIPKTYLPNDGEFQDMRWFASGLQEDSIQHDSLLNDFPLSTRQLLQVGDCRVGVEICHDLWAPIPMSTEHALAGAQVIVNLSASNALPAKAERREALVMHQASTLHAGYVYASAGRSESTHETVFGAGLIIAEGDECLLHRNSLTGEHAIAMADIDVGGLANARGRDMTWAMAPRAKIQYRLHVVDVTPNITQLKRMFPKIPYAHRPQDLQEAFDLQVAGLAGRLKESHSKKVVVGVSGGLDSTLALLVAVRAAQSLGWPAEDVIGITMPGPGTSKATRSAAVELMQHLGVTAQTIDINPVVAQMQKDVHHPSGLHDTTYENMQARARMQLLYTVANQINGLPVNTGTSSEGALGWCTVLGDHGGAYAVNASIPKTAVRLIVSWQAQTYSTAPWAAVLNTILNFAYSPELLPTTDGASTQVTEDLVGPYELHDFFMHHLLVRGASAGKILCIAVLTFSNYTPDVIAKWLKTFLRRFCINQFKRTWSPAGPLIIKPGLSPRTVARYPDNLAWEPAVAEVDVMLSSLQGNALQAKL